MKKIRIGNNVAFTWNINVSGEPYDLTGKQLNLYISTPGSVTKLTDFSVSGNSVSGIFYGASQKISGIYSLTLVENEAGAGMITIDRCNAFQLVPWSCMEGCSPDGELTLESDAAFCRINPVIPVIGENGNWWVNGEDTGKPAFIEAGMSAYDLAVLHGFTGTVQEWLLSLNNGSMPVLAPKPADPVAGQYHFNTLRQGIGVFDGTRWNWTERRGNKGLRVVVGRSVPMFPEVGTAYVFTDGLLKVKVEHAKLTKFGGSINLSRFGNVSMIVDFTGKKIVGMTSGTISIEDWVTEWGNTIVIFFEGNDILSFKNNNALHITSSGCIQDCGCKLCRIYSSKTASPFLVLSKGKIICIKPVRKYITETSQLVSTSTLLVKRWKGTRRKQACTQPGTKYKRLSYRRRYVTIHRLGRSGQTPNLRSYGLRLRLQSVHRSRFVSVLPQDIYVRKGFLAQ